MFHVIHNEFVQKIERLSGGQALKEKFFWTSIGLIVASWIFNYSYYEAKQLDNPVFFDHFYEKLSEEEIRLTFYYLTNKSNSHRVTSVSVDGITTYPAPAGVGFTMFDSGQPQVQYERQFRYYYLKAVTVILRADQIPAEPEESWSFDQVQISYEDGTEAAVDIGEVVIYPRSQSEETLKTEGGASGRGHRMESRLRATEALTITDMDIPFPDVIGDDMMIKVDADQERMSELIQSTGGMFTPDSYRDGLDQPWEDVPGTLANEDLWPVSLREGDWLRLLLKFDPEQQAYWQFGIKLRGETEAGEQFIRPVLINDQPALTEENIAEIIKEKGGSTE